MIEINSYSGVNGIGFGASQADVIGVFGEPRSRRKNYEKESEFHFSDFIIRFEATSGHMREITLVPKCNSKINGVPVIWTKNFLHWLANEDKELVEVLGFVLSLKLGIATSGFHAGDDSEMTIHAFNRGDWDEFQKRMRPFSVTQ